MTPDPDQMTVVAAPYRTVSDRIRALDRAGYARADIARFLNKRYQHVRNVLEADAQARRTPANSVFAESQTLPADLQGVAEGPITFEPPALGMFRLQVKPDGSAVLPPSLLQAMGAAPGEPFMAEVGADAIVLRNWRESARRAQAFVRSVVPPGVSLVDELIAERRADARREAEGG